MACAHLGDQRNHPLDLLGGVDVLALRPGADPADVDDVGAIGDGLSHGGQCGLPGEGRAPVVEGIPGAIDDAHHQRTIRVNPSVSESQ